MADNRRLSVLWGRTTSPGAANDPRVRWLSIYGQICSVHFLLAVLAHSNKVLWVISRDVWRRLQLLNKSASPLPSPSFQVCRPVDSKICLFQSPLSPGCCRPGCPTFWLFPGLLRSHFCFFTLFDFCYLTWLFTGRPSLRCRGGFLIICINYLELLSAAEFN